MNKTTDQELDLSIAAMLRFGVSLSALIVLVGGILFLHHSRAATANFSHFTPGDPALRSLTGPFEGAIDFAPQSIIQVGLIVLIATPIARVVFCVVGFARQRNLLYVSISVLVLAVLFYSLVHSGI